MQGIILIEQFSIKIAERIFRYLFLLSVIFRHNLAHHFILALNVYDECHDSPIHYYDEDKFHIQTIDGWRLLFITTTHRHNKHPFLMPQLEIFFFFEYF